MYINNTKGNVVFPWQLWLCEIISVLTYTYMPYLFILVYERVWGDNMSVVPYLYHPRIRTYVFGSTGLVALSPGPRTYTPCVTWPVKVNSILQELYYLADKRRQCSIKCTPNWWGSI